jgi:hypothetical protein
MTRLMVMTFWGKERFGPNIPRTTILMQTITRRIDRMNRRCR